MDRQVSAREPARHRAHSAVGGTAGNEKLTAMTGAVLLVGFAIEGFTVLEIRRLLFLHFLVGLLLIGPVLLKIGSTMYRFISYYTGAQPYVRNGPPAPLLRALGPLVILTSIAVLGTGVILAVTGPGTGPWLLLHKAAFIAWFAVMTIHVLNYAPRLPRLLGARPAGPGSAAVSVAGARIRCLALALSLAAGAGVAAAAMNLSVGWGIRF
jgi:hypothetical protein